MYYRILVDFEYIKSFKDFGEYCQNDYTHKKTKAMRIRRRDLDYMVTILDYFGFNMELVTFEVVSYVGDSAKVYYPSRMYASY